MIYKNYYAAVAMAGFQMFFQREVMSRIRSEFLKWWKVVIWEADCFSLIFYLELPVYFVLKHLLFFCGIPQHIISASCIEYSSTQQVMFVKM